jgi:hypothetical protein
MFGSAVFEAIEAKGHSRLNFEVETSNFLANFENLVANLEKVSQTSL